ncbi:hypothetical protein [Dyella flagellata]|uniref:Uncharacterized protein n=1 Tax=Dyella flagellata TaxID=1867833 RepID=A0ABQ5X8V2_9GAMM|nr:hypothetical protein [Dyella flagellata]GLQ88023.1 hypothetical protein GCM10007898_15920 [Dyella flagellata]
MPMIENRDEQFRELCAQYGAVMYLVQAFENEVANANTCIDLAPGHPRAAAEEADCVPADEPFTAGLHNLVARLSGLTFVPATLISMLDQAKSRRDFLIKRFFRDRAESFYCGRGDELLEELEGHGKFFHGAEKSLQDFMCPLLLKLGFTQASMQGEFDMYLATPDSRMLH